MKKIMEKSKYIQPEISICHVETDHDGNQHRQPFPFR